jgi:hypothetical protein
MAFTEVESVIAAVMGGLAMVEGGHGGIEDNVS